MTRYTLNKRKYCKKKPIAFIFFLFFFMHFGQMTAKNISPQKRIDILNIGSIAYPDNLEERSDIPFKLLVHNEFRKRLPDSADYEKFRPTLLFLEKGFATPEQAEKTTSFAYISISALSGTYHFPKEITDLQKKSIETNIKADVHNNLVGTSFELKKWNPFEFKSLNGLMSIQYSYEQTFEGKTPTRIITTSLYDSNVELQIVLSAPQRDYAQWLLYYNEMVETFKRKINIADIAIFEYPTDIRERKDIPFRYLVDNEFKKLLGDSVDYEQFRPGLLFLNQDFAITDTTSIAPFGSISVNVLPQENVRTLKKDRLNLAFLEESIKTNVQQNLAATNYKINRWGEFKIIEMEELPALQYWYEQQLNGEQATMVYSTYIFDKDAQIQINMSSPVDELPGWQDKYSNIIGSYQRLVKIPALGTMSYPLHTEERSDIPFAMLVDKESKKKLGDSIDYERFRPTLLFLESDFNENDPAQLESFGSITINTIEGDFSRLNEPKLGHTQEIESEIRDSVIRNLQNTGYLLTKWISFDSVFSNGTRKISYSYTQQAQGNEPTHISVTCIYTNNCQIPVTLTCPESDYSSWKPRYDRMVQSFRPLGWR